MRQNKAYYCLVFPHFNFKFRFFFLNSNHLILLVDKFDEEFNFTTLNDNQNFVIVFLKKPHIKRYVVWFLKITVIIGVIYGNAKLQYFFFS